LKNNRVTHIVTCCPCSKYPQEGFDGVERMLIAGEDTPQYPMLRHLPKVAEFFNKKRRDNAGLLQCRKGINRSAVLGIALRIRQVVKNMTKDGMQNAGSHNTRGAEILGQAWRSVSEHRGQLVIMNPGFQRQLYMYTHLLLTHGYRSTWPAQWGPEIWMPISPVVCPGTKIQVQLRQLRLEVEKRSFVGGLDEAFGQAARAVVLHMEHLGIQVLASSNAAHRAARGNSEGPPARVATAQQQLEQRPRHLPHLNVD